MTRAQKGLTIWLAILAGFQTLTAGSDLAGFVGDKNAGGVRLLVAAMLAATAAYTASMNSLTRSQVNTLQAVADKTEVTSEGKLAIDAVTPSTVAPLSKRTPGENKWGERNV